MKPISIVLLNSIPDKKMKSLGNKCLIKINNKYIIDQYLLILNIVFKNPEIIIVGGKDNKKLIKHLSHTKYDNLNIKHIEHPIDRYTNIGSSVVSALKYISNNHCLFINTSILMNNKINKYLSISNGSYVVTSKNNRGGGVGCIIDNNLNITSCHYGLQYHIFDILYISDKDMIKFKKIASTVNFEKLFLFEIINLCIDNNIPVSAKIIDDNILTNIYDRIKNKNA